MTVLAPILSIVVGLYFALWLGSSMYVKFDEWRGRLKYPDLGRNPTHVTVSSPGFKPFPFAHVTAGSLVVHTTTGITRWHALGRAAKWAKKQGARGELRVSSWANEKHDPA